MTTDDDDTPTTSTPPPRVTWTLVVLAWSAVAVLIWVMQWGPANPPPPPCDVGRGGVPVCSVPLTAIWPALLTGAVIVGVAATVLACFCHFQDRAITPSPDPASDPNEGDHP